MARQHLIMWTQHGARTRQVKPDDWRMWLAYVSTGSSGKSCSNQIWISYGCQLNATNEVQLRKATRCQTEQTYAVDFQVRSNRENDNIEWQTSIGLRVRRRKWWKQIMKAVWNQKESLRKSERMNDIEFQLVHHLLTAMLCNAKRKYTICCTRFRRADCSPSLWVCFAVSDCLDFIFSEMRDRSTHIYHCYNTSSTTLSWLMVDFLLLFSLDRNNNKSVWCIRMKRAAMLIDTRDTQSQSRVLSAPCTLSSIRLLVKLQIVWRLRFASVAECLLFNVSYVLQSFSGCHFDEPATSAGRHWIYFILTEPKAHSQSIVCRNNGEIPSNTQYNAFAMVWWTLSSDTPPVRVPCAVLLCRIYLRKHETAPVSFHGTSIIYIYNRIIRFNVHLCCSGDENERQSRNDWRVERYGVSICAPAMIIKT